MTRMQINGSERDTVRLFHLDLPREAVERFVTQAGTGEWPLKYGLGAQALREAFVDVVDLRDLGEMPLSQYLVAAHGASGEDFTSSKPQIDGLRGHVVILPSQAFDTVSQELNIATPLRWIGTFAEVKGKPRGAKLSAATALGAATGSGAGGGIQLSVPMKILAWAVIFCILLAVYLALR